MEWIKFIMYFFVAFVDSAFAVLSIGDAVIKFKKQKYYWFATDIVLACLYMVFVIMSAVKVWWA